MSLLTGVVLALTLTPPFPLLIGAGYVLVLTGRKLGRIARGLATG